MTPDHQADARRIVDDAQVDPKSPQWHWLSSAIAAALSRAYEAGARDGSLRIEDTYQAILRLHGIAVRSAYGMPAADKLAAEGAADDGWQPIETAPVDEETLLLAGCPPDESFPDGRVMIWRASMLARNLRGPTPNHLQFPATHWRNLPAPPKGQNK